jgi:hypothetical protein
MRRPTISEHPLLRAQALSLLYFVFLETDNPLKKVAGNDNIQDLHANISDFRFVDAQGSIHPINGVLQPHATSPAFIVFLMLLYPVGSPMEDLVLVVL